MQFKSKKHWDDFIYGLLYPGFVGSMIYELIPQEQTTIATYFSLTTLIKIIITFFYSVDYLHLYGDMHETVIEKKRTWTYLWCDVFSSLFFFLAFVAVKLGHYGFSVAFLSIIPFLFYSYKKKNKQDRIFHLPYMMLSLGFAFFYGLNSFFKLQWKLFSNAGHFLFWFALVSFLIYCFYVFIYYESKSKDTDKKIYSHE